jgi:hypothetical protein
MSWQWHGDGWTWRPDGGMMLDSAGSDTAMMAGSGAVTSVVKSTVATMRRRGCRLHAAEKMVTVVSALQLDGERRPGDG